MDARLMTGRECVEFLGLLRRGASAAAASRHLGLPAGSFEITCAKSPGFRQLLRSVVAELTDNVCAALYQKAMKGSVSAQLAWLRLAPAPEWRSAASAAEGSAAGSSAGEVNLEALSDEELEAMLDKLKALPASGDPFVEGLLKEGGVG